MIGEEIEVVAEELAKSGGLSWYPGHTPGPLMRLVTDHYRDQARVIIGGPGAPQGRGRLLLGSRSSEERTARNHPSWTSQ
jgi:hypothetical protein